MTKCPFLYQMRQHNVILFVCFCFNLFYVDRCLSYTYLYTFHFHINSDLRAFLNEDRLSNLFLVSVMTSRIGCKVFITNFKYEKFLKSHIEI